MRRHRKVKIVATLGPSSSDFATIRALFEAGADVFRLNMSHGTHDEQRARYDIIRRVEEESGRPIAVLADLQGPKIRVGKFAEGKVQLLPGAPFVLDAARKEPGDVAGVGLDYKELPRDVKPGDTLLLEGADGGGEVIVWVHNKTELCELLTHFLNDGGVCTGVCHEGLLGHLN